MVLVLVVLVVVVQTEQSIEEKEAAMAVLGNLMPHWW